MNKMMRWMAVWAVAILLCAGVMLIKSNGRYSYAEEPAGNERTAVEICEVSGESFRGTLMIIPEPSRVFLGAIPEFGPFEGMTVQEITESCNADNPVIMAGMNGGEFDDFTTEYSYTGQPVGVVISEGKILYAENEDMEMVYHLTGITDNNQLVTGEYTLSQAMELGIRDAVYVRHETGPSLIRDGEILWFELPSEEGFGGGKNARAAIGQCADGAILLLAIDGRQEGSLGADYQDLAMCMKEHGAVTAAAMQMGSSVQLVYEGELLNHPFTQDGPRKCPTAWLVRY